MAKQNITLHIADKPYRFAVEAESEELYRMAANTINSLVAQYVRKKPGFSMQDCMAMAALYLARENVAMSRSREVGDEDVRRMEEITRRIEEYLSQEE